MFGGSCCCTIDIINLTMGCAGSNLSQTDMYKKSTNFEIVDHGLYCYESKYQVNAKTKAKDASKMIPLGRVGPRTFLFYVLKTISCSSLALPFVSLFETRKHY